MKIIAFSFIGILASTAAYAGGFVNSTGGVEDISVGVSSSNDWTGFYAGLQFGSGDGTLSFSGRNVSEDTNAGGFHFGYMRDFGQVVIGGEFAFDRMTLSDGDQDDGAYLGRLRGRVGYNAGRFMPYVTFGTAALTGEDDDDLSETGFTYGIGGDYQITNNFIVGLDYSRTSFSDVLSAPGLNLDADLLQLKASYKF